LKLLSCRENPDFDPNRGQGGKPILALMAIIYTNLTSPCRFDPDLNRGCGFRYFSFLGENVFGKNSFRETAFWKNKILTTIQTIMKRFLALLKSTKYHGTFP